MPRTSLLLPLLVLGVIAGAGAWEAQDDPASPVSEVSRTLLEYEPPTASTPSTAASRATAAKAFLAALSEERRAQASFPLEHDERARWTNTPPGTEEGGVRLGDCTAEELRSALDLLAVVLGAPGYRKVRDILLADDRLLPGGRPRRGFGAVNYWLAIFAEPSEQEPWALQLDGHHLALNLSFEGEAVGLSPTFVGTQPSRYRRDDAEVVPMAEEVARAHALVQGLPEELRAEAVVGPRRRGNVAAAGKDGFVPERVGVPVHRFDPDSKRALLALLRCVIETLPATAAARRMEELESELDHMHFAWWGPIASGSDMSYRVQGPSLILEFAGQDLGGDPLDHLHSMIRDPTCEYRAVRR